MLNRVHGINISIRQLHRYLREQNLYRKRNQSSIADVTDYIESQLIGSGSSIGYRQMHQRCLIHGLRVSRRNVSYILQVLDPLGVETRRRNCLRRRLYYSQGPNWVWHIDGYDKLKPYGFSIHGAIDGYSRKILWLDIFQSNKDPSQICSAYVESIININGIPRKVIGDRGSENVYVAASQRFLRRNQDDGMAGQNSFTYGRSVSNQRIEAWWSMLRRSCTNWWMNYFKDLIDQGFYDTTNPMQVECLKFCYLSIIRNELIQMKNTWNNHRIRRNQSTQENYRPCGIPNILYHALENNVIVHKKEINFEDLAIVEDTCCEMNNHNYICSREFFDLASIIIEENNFELPNNAAEAFQLYTAILEQTDNI